jgi:hypothetical protein
MDIFDRAQWHREIAGIFDIDDDLGPAMGRNLPHRADGLLAVVQEDIETFLYFFHYPLLGLDTPQLRALSTKPGCLG